MWTINNPKTDTPLFVALPEGVRFITWQLERGQQGTPHYQGYLTTFSNWRRSRVVTLLGGHAFAEPAIASGEDCSKYCNKEDTRIDGPWTIGKLVKERERTDLKPLQKAVQDVLQGKPLSEVDPMVLVKHARGLRSMLTICMKPKFRKLKVVCIVGASGIGKTFWVFNRFPDVYRPLWGNSGAWFDGYLGGKVLLLDEFKAQVPLQKLLQWLDPYSLRVEIKGGEVAANWDTVFITSNCTPDTWYQNINNPETLMALKRRVGFCDMSLYPDTDAHYVYAETRESLQEQLNAIFPDPDMPIVYYDNEPLLPAQEAVDLRSDSPPIVTIDEDQEAAEALIDFTENGTQIIPAEPQVAPDMSYLLDFMDEENHSDGLGAQPLPGDELNPIVIEDDETPKKLYKPSMCDTFP